MRLADLEYSSTATHASIEATATDEVEDKAQTAPGEEVDLTASTGREDDAEYVRSLQDMPDRTS